MSPVIRWLHNHNDRCNGGQLMRRWWAHESSPHTRPWLTVRFWLALAVIVVSCLVLAGVGPAQAAVTHHHRARTIDVEISDPLFTTIFVHNPHNYKDGYSAIRVTFKVKTLTSGTPADFMFQVVLYKWNKANKPKLYNRCGRRLRRECVSLWLKHDLPPVNKSKTWILDAACVTGSFFVRTTVKNYNIGGKPAIEFFPTEPPHLKEPTRKESWLVGRPGHIRCPKYGG